MLRIENLVKSYGGAASGKKMFSVGKREAEGTVYAISDVTLDIGEGEMFTLLGPSGCGKTTTLRSVAGLEIPDSGKITLSEKVLFSSDGSGVVNIPANERGLGMVFQSYAIWPHMTVFENVAFPLTVMKRNKRPSKKQIAERVERVLATMELSQYADRHATKLSGGQQQRLALARAIVVEPPLLLLDEPLSNLDAKLRESLRYELKRLQRDMGITSIYVTHDQIEALALSSTIAVMEAGKVVQTGKPRDVYQRPNNRFVAEFIGTSNFIPGTVVSRSGQEYTVDTAAGPLVLSSDLSLTTGQPLVVSIRPETIEISTDSAGPAAANEWSGDVRARAFLGDAVDHIVAVNGEEFRVRGNPALSLAPGTAVSLRMSPDALTLVPVD